MNVIKINNYECEVMSYNKSTGLSDNTIVSTAYCEFINTNEINFDDKIFEPITSIQIYHDNNLIYNLSDITAHIESVNEYFNGERMVTNINMRFDFE